MRTLAILVKSPAEPWRDFNHRLAEACAIFRPTFAHCALVPAAEADDQPKVALLSVDHGAVEPPPVRAAVCPLAADDAATAQRTEQRLAQVLALAEGHPVMTQDTDPPLVTLFVWPLASPTTSEPPGDGEEPREAAGRTSGRPPFGMRRRGGQLVPHPSEAAVVRSVLAAAEAHGSDLDPILAALSREHAVWLDLHWHPKRRGEYVLAILDRVDFYRNHLGAATP